METEVCEDRRQIVLVFIASCLLSPVFCPPLDACFLNLFPAKVSLHYKQTQTLQRGSHQTSLLKFA